jgi:hypothetical protein
MSEVSASQVDSARKIETCILKGLATVGQSEIASRTGTSESTISRLKDGQLGLFASVLAASGLKVVPSQYKCIDPVIADAMMKMYDAAMKKIPDPASLLWGED